METRAHADASNPTRMMMNSPSGVVRTAPPPLVYLIACAPRTGSYLLCEGLETTGVAGCPTESFSPEYRHEFCLQILGQDTTLLNSIATVVRHGTSGNGIFGAKIHWAHVEGLAWESEDDTACDFLLRELPNARYIHLYREDSSAQAISLHRAHQTEEWWRIQGVTNPYQTLSTPIFDLAEILKLKREMIRQHEAWEDFFKQARISALHLTYEELDRDYRGTIGKVLDFLGLNSAHARDIPEPRIQKQADQLNVEWKKRLEADLMAILPAA